MAGERLILGIDPGSRAMGFGLVTAQGSRLNHVAAGVLRPRVMEPFSYRLKELYQGVSRLIEEFSPQEAAVEQVFVARNAKAALKLGHARAAAMLAALNMGLSVYEYTPLEIKKAVVGYGQAEKGQVRQMVRLLLNLSKMPALDASDALAAAICHANTMGLRTHMELTLNSSRIRS